jgi:hypothetical protein
MFGFESLVWREADMKLLSVAVAAIVGLSCVGAQTVPVSGGETARQVLDQFLKADLAGERLEQLGAHDLSRFFTGESKPPRGSSINIVSNDYHLDQTEPTPGTVKFGVGFGWFYGNLDAEANFIPAPTDASTGVEIKEGMIALFTLSNKNRGTTTSSAWKIESPAQPICVNLSTAQRYLAAVSKSDPDATRRANAARALVELRRVRPGPHRS